MKTILIIVKLFFLGGLLIISNYNLHMGDIGERATFFNMYSMWIDDLASSSFKATAYLVKFEWLPAKNESMNSMMDSKYETMFFGDSENKEETDSGTTIVHVG